MNVLSLFTGVGGFDLGLERAGFRIVGQCEVDARCRQVLRRHWPGVPLSENVTTLDGEWIARNSVAADLIVGGFPCQDLSVAGRRAGLAGERSGLFHEAARIADLVLRPGGWLLIENVPGLLSSNEGRDFAIVLSTLADLGFHDLAWRVLDSRYFGVPQRRRRVFILARRSRGDRAKQVLLEPEGGGGDFAPSREAGEESAASFGQSVAGSLGFGKGKQRHDLDNHGAYVGKMSDRTGDTLVRRLTPVECERLQGFPDGFTIPDETPWQEYPTPDGPRYAQMGNAVTVPVIEWIGHRIKEYGLG